MANTVTQPAVSGIVVRAPGPSPVRQAAAQLAPLARVAGQDNTPYTSPWVQVPPGSFLEVQLGITHKVGNLVSHRGLGLGGCARSDCQMAIASGSRPGCTLIPPSTTWRVGGTCSRP
jgi:hypothetical protein